MAFARALLTSGPPGRCGHICADLRDPGDAIAGAAACLDLIQPVAILLANVLDYVISPGQAPGIIRRLATAVAPGSYLVICHLTAEISTSAVQAATSRWNQLGGAPAVLRTPAELTGLFDGLDLIDPGVVSCLRWRPDITGISKTPDVPHYGGVGRTPANKLPPETTE